MLTELGQSLLDAGFESGWAVRDNKIVLWVNEEPIPDEFIEYVELDEA
jgi:hypothetical protein